MKRLPPRPSLRQVTNPPSPWPSTRVDWVGEPPAARLRVLEDATRGILSRNTSPDIPFTWSLNPYRGCYHGCAYCYARPSHHYLDLGAGTDFERVLVVKPRAAELLREAFASPRWRGELLVFSGNTDCYQPLEAAWGLTRACLEVCLEHRQPVSVITKSPLVERDVALLVELEREAGCRVTVSVPFDDARLARAVEPYVASPARRYEAIAALAAAGVPVGVNVAPVIPGLNDGEIPTILARAREAGAAWAGRTLVRLPGPVAEVFAARLREALPDRAARVLAQIAACRGGALDEGRFGARMTGRGARWAAVEALWDGACARLGYGPWPATRDPSPFVRRARGRQLTLL